MPRLMAREAMRMADERGAKIMTDKMMNCSKLRKAGSPYLHPVCGGEIWESGTRRFCIKCREIVAERKDIPSRYNPYF